MSSKTLSSVTEKHIRHLCLTDFPCGNGSWVSVIDEGLLKFSKLEELVLSANRISEIPAHNLPSTLKKVDTQAGFDTAHVAEDVSSAADLQSSENCKREASKADAGVLTVYTEETGHVIAHVSKHSTSKLTWSECMDFSDTHIHVVSELGDLKKFLNQGLNLWIEEEKVLSWPAVSEDIPESKPNQAVKDKKGMKGRESPIKSTAAKDKSKDKKKKTVLELVQDAPIRRSLGSIHIPLQSLVEGDRKVAVLCNLGFLRTESEMGPTQTHEKVQKRVTDSDRNTNY
ncbi:hypothetical protein F2P81_013966 [Scophthalmus maximus]|uniref:Leucine-rich repeat-containing protein 43 n=1 Tax=Scophthalmus maximus TaxID=52904 RepID=A0A6A4SPQ2_SCOMX|nr:hypothetical protein F2P81_013966 [Scophthalmus maximus]